MLDRLGALLDDRPSKLCIRQESGDGIGKRVGISRSSQHSGAVMQHLPGPARVGRRNWGAKGQGFEHGGPQPLMERAGDVNVRVGNQPGWLIQVTQQVDAAFQSQRTTELLQRGPLPPSPATTQWRDGKRPASRAAARSRLA